MQEEGMKQEEGRSKQEGRRKEGGRREEGRKEEGGRKEGGRKEEKGEGEETIAITTTYTFKIFTSAWASNFFNSYPMLVGCKARKVLFYIK
jgi:hypothetical protein